MSSALTYCLYSLRHEIHHLAQALPPPGSAFLCAAVSAARRQYGEEEYGITDHAYGDLNQRDHERAHVLYPANDRL